MHSGRSERRICKCRTNTFLLCDCGMRHRGGGATFCHAAGDISGWDFSLFTPIYGLEPATRSVFSSAFPMPWWRPVMEYAVCNPLTLQISRLPRIFALPTVGQSLPLPRTSREDALARAQLVAHPMSISTRAVFVFITESTLP